MNKILGVYPEKEIIKQIKSVRFEDCMVKIELEDGEPVSAYIEWGKWTFGGKLQPQCPSVNKWDLLNKEYFDKLEEEKRMSLIN